MVIIVIYFMKKARSQHIFWNCTTYRRKKSVTATMSLLAGVYSVAFWNIYQFLIIF